MSYKINDKLYTDNPLLDEIVYNAKIMLNGIVLKDSDEADNNETEDSIALSDIYMSIRKGVVQFSMFEYTSEILSQIDDFSSSDVIKYEKFNNLIPDEYKEELANIAAEEFVNNYVEYNNYYRMLNGLPDYGTEEYYVPESYVLEVYRSYFDFSLPISQYTDYQIGLLEKIGVLTRIQNENTTLLYLHHMGTRRISIFDARSADKFEVIYLPDAEELVRNRFLEILERDRLIYYRRHYSLAYKFNSKYYDKMFMIMIISQAVTDLIAETPEWYIRRDIFDARTVEYILRANGVRYFSNIPLKYQISLVRILNKVVKYKSTNKNIFDLASIFGFDNVTVYKYYLLKNRLVDGDGKYVTKYNDVQIDPEDPDSVIQVEDLMNMYELVFIRTPIDDLYDNYINNNLNLTDYDTMTIDDPYWDSVNDHNYVKSEVLKKDFTILPTKYLSFDTVYSISEYQFQLQYFLNLIMNNHVDISELNLKVPIINATTSFNIRDLFILLYLISFNYYENPTDDIIINTNRDCYEPTKVYEEVIWNQYNPEEDEDLDGGGANDDDFIDECDAGLAYRNDPPYNNANGSNQNYIKEHDNSEDEPEKDIETDGAVSFGYDDYSDYDGGDPDDDESEVNLNGGRVKNTFINIKSGTDYYERPSKYFEEEFDKVAESIDLSNRLYGFNLNADLNYLADIVGRIHPHFNWERGYTLEDLGVAGFLTATNNKVTTIEELMNIYKTNKVIYDNFIEAMITVNNRYEYDIYKFTYDYLFTFEMDQSYYKSSDGTTPRTYKDYLINNNIMLYQFYLEVMNETDIDLRQYNITEYVDAVISSLNAYIQNENLLKHIYYFIPTLSWSTVLQYLFLLINFFKSYKTQFLDPGATLDFDHLLDNKINIMDNMQYKDIQYNKVDNISTMSTLSFDLELNKPDNALVEEKIFVYPDYDKEYYELNGWRANQYDTVYLSIDGNKYINIDGTSYDVTNLESIDMDGGTMDSVDETMDLNAGTAIACEDNAFIDLDGGGSEDIEGAREDLYNELLDWDGGVSDTDYYTDNINGGPAREQLFYADYCEDIDEEVIVTINPNLEELLYTDPSDLLSVIPNI